ncbi:hypothetical protein [Engelhardtia mirabilis]|uniref:hypothetical protein n=1 Tax=Engelhardtia mirabilis TaxID=2528011 RepID=UPI0011A45539
MLMSILLVALLGALGTALLSALAPHLGWLDPRPGSIPMERKSQVIPAAPVGGVVLVTIAALGLPTALATELTLPPLGGLTGPSLIAVLAAFVLGSLDDWLPTGLSPWSKVFGQFAASLPLLVDGGPWTVVVALVAMNAVNTFDNSDGAAASFGAVALLLPGPAAAGALLGFLPWNLRRGGPVLPKAYLGDAGSHAVGMLVAVHPAAWPALALPVMDLLRVLRLRRLAGQAPWVGDRRHLPQALERAGLGGPARCALIAAIAAPAALASAIVADSSMTDSGAANSFAAVVGVVLTGAAFLGLCALIARRTEEA